MPLWRTSDLSWLSEGWNSERDRRCSVLNLPNSGRHSLPSCYIPQEGQKERTPERRAACQMWIKQFPDTLRLSLRADQIWATKRVKISGVLSRRKCNQRAAEGPHGTEIKSYITSRVFCRLEKKNKNAEKWLENMLRLRRTTQGSLKRDATTPENRTNLMAPTWLVRIRASYFESDARMQTGLLWLVWRAHTHFVYCMCSPGHSGAWQCM